jgi:hypothetical protein
MRRDASDNRSVHRGIAAVLIVWVIASSVATAAVCDGWRPTPGARHACCAASEHDDAGQLSVDSCCAQSEQAQQPRTFCPAISGAPPPAAWTVVPALLLDVHCSARRTAAATFERAIQQRPHSPPSFLSSVLLI